MEKGKNYWEIPGKAKIPTILYFPNVPGITFVQCGDRKGLSYTCPYF
jgi:hypothetical protein